jgi:hypothetical protein
MANPAQARKQWQRVLTAYRSLASVKKQAHTKMQEADALMDQAKAKYSEAAKELIEVQAGLQSIKGLLRTAEIPDGEKSLQGMTTKLIQEARLVDGIIDEIKTTKRYRTFGESYKKLFIK